MGFTSNEYSSLYGGAAKQLLEQERLTSMLGNSKYNNIYNTYLSNHRDIKRYILDYSKMGLLDYQGKYDEVSLEGTWVTVPLRYDRSMKFTFDKLEREFDGDMGAMSIEVILKEAIKQKAIPEIDATNMEACWQALEEYSENISESPTLDTILADIQKAIRELEEANLPSTEQQLFMSYEAYQTLLDALSSKSNIYISDMNVINSEGLNFVLPSIQGVAIQRMPSTRFYTKIQRFAKADQDLDPLNVGYAKADDGEKISWLLVPRQYVDPIVKLSDIKIKMDSVDNTDDRNNKAAYNIFYDCLVQDNMKQYFRGALAQ